MINVIGIQNLAGKFLQQEALFVARSIRTKHPEFSPLCPQLQEFFRNGSKGNCPRDRFQLAVLPHQRGGQTLRMLVEIERIAALDTKKLAIDSGTVAIVGTNNL